MAAPRVCSRPGCGRLTTGGRCDTCTRTADKARGTSRERGYNSVGHQRFRTAVLDRDPICVECQLAASTVADHYPHSRRDLIVMRLDPNDPARGRGVCKRCHDRSTARLQPGGWHAQHGA